MKVTIAITVEEEDLRVIDKFCELTGMNRSKVFRDMTRGLVVSAKAAQVLSKKKVSKLDLLRMLSKGATLNPLA